MKACEIVEILEKLSPVKYACSWDNVGMHVGRTDREINKILVALDIDDAAVSKAVDIKADMIVAHHPLLFRGIKQVNDADITGRRIITMIENGINGYCMHTNFDCVGGMAEDAAARLGLTGTEVLEEVFEGEGIGKVGNLVKTMTVRELCELIKGKFNLERVILYGNETDTVKRVAICPGSGKDELEPALLKGAEVIITGDITYHYGKDYSSMGINIIDAGHYGIEHIFIDKIGNYLLSELKDTEIVKMEIENPQKFI